MRAVALIDTARSRKLHVTASGVQSHIWYHDNYVATLCGQWLQVHDMDTDMNLDNPNALGDSLCGNCHGRYLHVG
jgi:hypothetical protein